VAVPGGVRFASYGPPARRPPGGNCLGALLGGAVAARFGITAPFWAGFVVAVIVSAATWRVFDRATVAEAYTEPADPVPYT
jgi:hypothetical protein